MRLRLSKIQTKAITLLVIFVLNLIGVPVMALTSGPSQPESQSFQPAGATEMVDLFSGDFNYNIPLFELPGPNGGYPFNLSYQAGINMEQEASWTGLGWSLNPGAVNRQVRGLPDEFKNESIYTKTAINPSITVGLGVGAAIEIFGKENKNDKGPKLEVGLSANFNNYKGFGYAIDASLGLEKATGGNVSFGLDVSLDSNEGVGIRPSLGLSGKTGSYGLSAGYNSHEGLSSLSLSRDVDLGKFKINEKKNGSMAAKSSVGASISFASPSYTPQVTMPMHNVSLSAKFEAGGSWWAVFPNIYVHGFYNEQWLKNNKKRLRTPAFGYLNYQFANGENDLMDFNREKDGMVLKESPNLAIPSMTYDIYSVTGQGIGAMYRPFRNDFGILHDQQVASTSGALSVGIDAAPAASHGGVNLSLSHSRSTSGKWVGDPILNATAVFQNHAINSLYEPWYFKTHGESFIETGDQFAQLGAEEAVRLKLNASVKNITVSPMALLEKRSGAATLLPDGKDQTRKPRNGNIQLVTNEQLLKGGEEMLPLFNVKYIDAGGNEKDYSRVGLPAHHTAGLTALTAEGLRYNYGIPAYNKSQEEVIFSASQTGNQPSVSTGASTGANEPKYEVGGTDKYLKKTEMPQYAHSFLLTSIVGPDYVDRLNDGVTADDLGYWVKFTYQQTTTSSLYQWRDPYVKAHYQEGWKTDPRDDKGQFTYGTKELWYLAKAETSSHIATFSISPREDGRGAANKIEERVDYHGANSQSVYQLDEIRLFSRFANAKNPNEIEPIKVVHFVYDYSLCKETPNNINTGINQSRSGKLTLKTLSFQYGSSNKGMLNPYTFSYNTEKNYSPYAFDRWGTYKPYPANNPMYNHDFPYALQDPTRKSEIDENASAWSLTQIILPSGGKIMVDYESDDYAYVQHKVAHQMMELVDPYTDSKLPLKEIFELKQDDFKIRFRLEKTIPGTETIDQVKEVKKYLDLARAQLYFKIKVNLRSPVEDFFEYINGYAQINADAATMGLEQDANNAYAYGYFHILPDKGLSRYNPLSVRAWQHLRINQPELSTTGKVLPQTNDVNERVSQIRSLSSGNIFTQIRQMFEGFNDFCAGKHWGTQVKGSSSWIRLQSPDKVKYGGGLRVRQVTLFDQWQQDNEGVYGQYYEYTTKDTDGTVISSGVAAYEPFSGGEENALRYAKNFSQSVPLRSDNNMYFEYPINETYYPGAQVGYSKVTVMSLPSASRAGKSLTHVKLEGGKDLFPTGDNVAIGITGMTVNEFYTARDFPVITYETDKDNKPFRLSVTIPFLGAITTSKLAASQGYSILTNDMHGKPRQTTNYRQDKKGVINPDPISWVKYNYRQDKRVLDGINVQVLNNLMVDNNDGTVRIKQSREPSSNVSVYMGQETEFMMDLREYEDNTWGGAGNFNVDVLYIPIVFAVIPVPVPTYWPNISKTSNQLRTAVTNKVVFRSGIMESTEVYNEGSAITTTNLKWDKLTGIPVLTSVNNNFDAPVFSYSIPAYTQYAGMGAAYQNIGLVFEIMNVVKAAYKEDQYEFTSPVITKLYEGDEILIYPATGSNTAPIARVIYAGQQEQKYILLSDTPLIAMKYQGRIIRSGYRNQLTVQAGSITALQDPSVKGVPSSYSKTLKISKP